MLPIFSTPKKYRRMSMLMMALNIGNIITFSSYIANWADAGKSWQGIFVIIFHILTIFVLASFSGKLSLHGKMFANMIRTMEGNGFIYDPDTREFRPGVRKDF